MAELAHQHVPKAGDFVANESRSAVLTVAVELSVAHINRGGAARLTAAPGGADPGWVGPPVEIGLSGNQSDSRLARIVDFAAGRIVSRRPVTERAYSGLATSKAEVTFVHNYPGGVNAAKGDGPIVLYLHNDVLRSYGRRELTRLDYHLDAVVAVSADLASRVPSLRAPIIVQNNGVSHQIFYPSHVESHERLRVAFLGRLVPEKGVHVMIAAANILREMKIDWYVVGSGTVSPRGELSAYERRLNRKVHESRASITPIRNMPRRDLPAFLRSIDVLCIPSLWADPCPLTVGEGMASGLAVVASRVGGIPEFAGAGSALVRPGCAEDIATFIESLDADRAQLAAWKGRAIARSAEVGWDDTLDSLVGSLNRVL